MLSEQVKILQLSPPAADRFSGTVTSQVVNMSQYRKCTFVIEAGVNTSSIGRIAPQVQACSRYDSATSVSPVTCSVQKGTNWTYGDTLAAASAVVVSGVNATSAPAAFQNTVLVIECNADQVRAAGSDGGFTPVGVRLVTSEVVDSPIVGSVLCILSEPLFGTKQSAYLVSGLSYRGY